MVDGWEYAGDVRDSDTLGDPEADPTWREVFRCPLCAALVDGPGRGDHNAWHSRIGG